MNTLKYMIAAVSCASLLFGCSKADENPGYGPDGGGVVTVRFEAEWMKSGRNASSTLDDTTIGNVTGYRFTDGIFREALHGEQGAVDGSYSFRPTGTSGEIVFIANDGEGLFGWMQPEISTYEEFMDASASIESMTSAGVLMTGRMELSEMQVPTMTVRMRRSVARIDLEIAESGVEIRKVSIRRIFDRGYITEGIQPSTPETAGTFDFSETYGESEFTVGRRTLLHLCEQTNGGMTAEVVAAFGGGLHRMTATLPETILRNRIYTLKVHGAGADLTVSVGTEGWEEGGSAESSPSLKGIIDTESSVLAEGIRISETRDSAYVSHLGGQFKLALLAEAGSTVDIEGSVRGVTAEVEARGRELAPAAAVSIQSTLRIPGEKRENIYLTVRRGEIHSGRIVVVFEPNPAQLSGAISFDDNGVCDFGKYVEGELGRLVLPEGKVARAEFDADEDSWMKLTEEDGEWRVLGGWKPNDPKADGRVQEGRIVISDADGSNAESYTVRRRNHGLPVVEIGGTWWCKYNLRGNVKSFDDQISIQEDPADTGMLADYLGSCDDDELLRLMGDQYQAGNTDGLPLRHNGTSFHYEGIKSSAQNFGTLDPTAMAPEGYRIPDYDDYAFFSGSNNYNIGGIGSRTYSNMAGEQISVRVIEREATFLGQSYGNVSIYEFSAGGASWVLFGLGHQWDTTPGNIATKMLLMATYSGNSNSWLMEGYANSVRPGQNWLKYAGNNSTKTRTIRCVKSPVEYIYD